MQHQADGTVFFCRPALANCGERDAFGGATLALPNSTLALQLCISNQPYPLAQDFFSLVSRYSLDKFSITKPIMLSISETVL